MPIEISDLTHPEYDIRYEDWLKWRLAYVGGRRFINTYTQKFSNREEDNDFNSRKTVTYCPSFAKSAINDVKNSIYQRFVDITRKGGTKSYQDAINGGKYGVDLLGSDLNSYIGRVVLPELLVMGRVGIYVDMPKIESLSNGTVNGQRTLKDDHILTNSGRIVPDPRNPSKANLIGRPYLYIYPTEDIRSWYRDEAANPNEFSTLLLREYKYTFDPDTRLPIDTYTIYKHFYLEDGIVYVQHYNEDNEKINEFGEADSVAEPLKLNITRIPFVVVELSESLMTDIADYQVALLNLASSDMAYSLKANFPFYVEQYEPRANSSYLKQDQSNNGNQDRDITVGPTSGRAYPVGTEQPAFIHPSPEPLKASMAKQEQLKEEIRLILNLTISNLQPSVSSAESKGFDDRTLESGLSYIGLELQHAERQIGQIWSMYENNTNYPDIKYPEKYNLKSDEDRRKDCKELAELMPILPSKTYQKEVAKSIADIMLRSRASDKTLDQIDKEIDSADVIHVDPQTLSTDVEHGLVSLDTASKARGYPEGEVDKAKQDHIDRLSRIAIAQSEGAAAELATKNSNPAKNGNDNPAARGIKDGSENPKLAAKAEKTQSQGFEKTQTTERPSKIDNFKRK